jgi:hypothetical protein
VVMVVYAIPFLVTNSDPRFRAPLDILAITHGVGLLSRGTDAIENITSGFTAIRSGIFA